MSWWIKEHIAVNEDETQQLCSIEADNQTSLPAADQSATAGFIIVRGSVAKDVSTGDVYIMNSSGTWIVQPSGVQLDLTGYATTQELTDGLAAKVDTSTYTAGQAAQDAEIGVVAAQGAKNMLKFDNAAGYILNTHGRTFEVLADGGIKITGNTPDSSYANFYVSGTWGNRDPIINDTEDNCILSFDCAVALQTQNLYIRAVDRRTGSTASTATAKLNQESGFAFPITTVSITVQPDVVLPSGGIIVYPMIRRAEITDDSYVPYAPTNRELYETSQSSYDFIFGLGTALQSNDDLNNYNRAGKIYAATGAIAATISNTPWTLSGFMVITIPMLTATTFIQFLLPSTSGGKWYKRRYTQGAWSQWIEYDGTAI